MTRAIISCTVPSAGYVTGRPVTYGSHPCLMYSLSLYHFVINVSRTVSCLIPLCQKNVESFRKHCVIEQKISQKSIEYAGFSVQSHNDSTQSFTECHCTVIVITFEKAV